MMISSDLTLFDPLLVQLFYYKKWLNFWGWCYNKNYYALLKAMEAIRIGLTICLFPAFCSKTGCFGGYFVGFY
jgi:hypothetical protein